MTLNQVTKKKPFKFGLGWQILVALILGVIAGALLHDNTEYKDWNGATKKGRRYLVAGKTTEDIIQEQEDTPF
jgi:hypothetical protein